VNPRLQAMLFCWCQEASLRSETLKQLQETAGNTLKQIGIGNNFLNRTQKAQHPRETMNKWDCIKLKSLCTTKEMVTRLKRQYTEWEKVFASYSSNKLKKLSPQRTNTQ
jgi:hypothetical protein